VKTQCNRQGAESSGSVRLYCCGEDNREGGGLLSGSALAKPHQWGDQTRDRGAPDWKSQKENPKATFDIQRMRVKLPE